MEMWQRSSYCDGGHCVEVRVVGGELIVVRSTIFPDVHLLVSPDEWGAFVAGVRAGEFDHLTP